VATARRKVAKCLIITATEEGIVASKRRLPGGGGNVTRESIREYAAALRLRYRAVGKAQRGVILDEFCRTTGYHRKAAVRLLNHRPQPALDRRGRPREYGPAVEAAVQQIWEASDRICSKRLAPFLPELVTALERHGEITLPDPVRTQLLQVSPATIDRLLHPERAKGGRRPRTSGSGSATLKAQIPLRTFGEWAEAVPGAVQADLVAHCGESTDGFYLTTLDVVDVATGWTECVSVWGKGQQRVGSALHQARQNLPFALRELHTDNGSEFVNAVVYPWCQRESIHFTRGRPYRKNDQAYVEQKNWSVVRRLIGYDRYSTKAAAAAFERLYRLIRLYVNFFQPVRKLRSKERVGAKVVKRYDPARTPYQRVLAAGVLTEAQQQALEQQYQRLNPVRLRAQIDEALTGLWELADRSRAVGAKVAAEAGEEPSDALSPNPQNREERR
jgi:hypothetical protein